MGGLLPDGTLGMHRQTLKLLPGAEGDVVAYRGLAIISNSISNGNAIINVNGQNGSAIGITVVSKTTGSMSFDGLGEYLNISNKNQGLINIKNNTVSNAWVYFLNIIF